MPSARHRQCRWLSASAATRRRSPACAEQCAELDRGFSSRPSWVNLSGGCGRPHARTFDQPYRNALLAIRPAGVERGDDPHFPRKREFGLHRGQRRVARPGGAEQALDGLRWNAGYLNMPAVQSNITAVEPRRSELSGYWRGLLAGVAGSSAKLFQPSKTAEMRGSIVTIGVSWDTYLGQSLGATVAWSLSRDKSSAEGRWDEHRADWVFSDDMLREGR